MAAITERQIMRIEGVKAMALKEGGGDETVTLDNSNISPAESVGRLWNKWRYFTSPEKADLVMFGIPLDLK